MPVVSVAPSPAFFCALIIYAVASLLYISELTQAPLWVRKAARWVLVLGFVAHGTDIGWRGVQAVHPGTSVREALGFLSWLVVGGYLIYSLRVRAGVLGAFVSPVALAILAAARLSPSGEPVPGLSLIGRIHISLATIGVALFALATAVSLFYLFQRRNLKRKRFGGVLFKRGLALETLDKLSHHLVLFGFPIFTISMMLGVVWASQRAMGFDRAEWPLAIVTWIAFAGLIVARTTVGWRGRRAALLTIVGFLAAVVVLGLYLARRMGG